MTIGNMRQFVVRSVKHCARAAVSNYGEPQGHGPMNGEAKILLIVLSAAVAALVAHRAWERTGLRAPGIVIPLSSRAGVSFD